MIRLLFILSILLFSCSDNLMQEVVEEYADGTAKKVNYYNKQDDEQKLVKIITFYENGHIEYEKNCKNNKLEGKLLYYYNSGQTNYEEFYKNGVREGEWISYTKDGKIKWKDNYVSGRINNMDEKHLAQASDSRNNQLIYDILW